jgi:hypothetical protein
MVGAQPVLAIKTARVPRIVWRRDGVLDVFEGGANLVA